MFHPTKCRDSRKYWGSLFPNIEHNSLIWFSLCSFVKNNLYWITGSLNFYLGKTFYSVIVARGSLRGARALPIFWSNEKKWVCNKRTIKVCVSCFWQCPGTFGPMCAPHLTVSLILCSSRIVMMYQVVCKYPTCTSLTCKFQVNLQTTWCEVWFFYSSLCIR